MYNKKHTATTVILLILFVVYLLVLFRITLFRDTYFRFQIVNLIPFMTIAEDLQFMLYRKSIMAAAHLLGNLIMFFPLGYLASVLFPKVRKLTNVMLLSFALSLFIETCQYVFACGVADIDDVILNTLGGIAGYWIYILTQNYFSLVNFPTKTNGVVINVRNT